MDCRTCKFAEWQKTSNGRRHPSGNGRCAREIKMPQLPKAFFWTSGSPPRPNGGYIRWKDALTHYAGCQLWMDKDTGC